MDGELLTDRLVLRPVAPEDLDAYARMYADPEVGYVLAREHWGRGYATEAATAVRDHALDGLDLRRLVALIAHGNGGSVRVAEKLGMRYERDVSFHGHPTMLYALEA